MISSANTAPTNGPTSEPIGSQAVRGMMAMVRADIVQSFDALREVLGLAVAVVWILLICLGLFTFARSSALLIAGVVTLLVIRAVVLRTRT